MQTRSGLILFRVTPESSSPNSDSLRDRYSRQAILPGIGDAGQRALMRAHAIVVGCGALGCGILDQLARAGIGRLTILDRDIVEWSNLQRQMLFQEEDAVMGKPKAIAARDRIGRINSAIEVFPHIADINSDNAEQLLLGAGKPTVILDGTDNLETRYLLNDFAVKHGVPLVYGGVIARRGMQFTIAPGFGPCLRCVFPEPGSSENETCDTAGVLGAAVAIVASLQAAAAIDLMADPARARRSLLTEFDLAASRFRTLDLSSLSSSEARSACVCCGRLKYEFLSGERARPAVSLCGSGAFQITGGSGAIDLAALATRLARVSSITSNEFFVRVRPRDGVEMTVFADSRAVVRGVANDGEARSLYDRYVGA